MSSPDESEAALANMQRLFEYEAEFEAQSAALQEAYQELSHSRDRYRTLFEEAPIAFVVIDDDTRILQVNAQGEALLERPRDLLLRTTLMSRVSPVHHVSLRANLDIALMRGRATTTVARLVGDELETWVRVDCGRMDLGGQRRLLVVLRDITRQHMAEDAVRTSEARFRALFEASVDAVALLDGASLTLQEVNPALVRLTGIGPEELIGARIRSLFPEDQRWAVSATLRQALHRGSAGPLAVTITREDGERRRIELGATAVRVGGGLFAMVSLRDVHEQWLAVQRRRAMERQLWQVQKVEMLGAMASGIAHDVNNTLAAIHGLTAALMADAQQAARPKQEIDDLGAILQATRRGKELTQNLLGFARQGAVERRVFDVRAVVDEVVGLARRALGTNIRLQTTIGDGLTVRGDPGQIAQVLLNLITNAAYASQGDDAVVRIVAQVEELEDRAVAEMQAGTYVRLAVIDEGMGMEPQVLARVFDAFYTTKPAGEGTGLGLAMARVAVDDHGGHIDIESELGKGTSVVLWLPLTEATPAGPRALVERESTVHHLLVIDDEPMVLRATARMLASDGYRVQSASGGVQGIEAFQAEPFDAVLVDLSMPDMDGEAVLRALAQFDSEAVLIGMTGHVERALPEDLTGYVAAVLRKPFGPDDLRRVLAVLDSGEEDELAEGTAEGPDALE